ncbi:Methyltransferase type 11 [Methylobacterium sp. 4-46]|uniref:class I SAM-dependent methyltransferase n=1 Tax=Methylobacterium sp. (strain 4-46) TaxID=426117 RepID=UPI000152C310|nr:class I SAM-dependent methyltransferase [Methylobacterium sp. 4-46]ACA18653.1 Methyltransferase type 11 [Methylobacterium sp. 4-46]
MSVVLSFDAQAAAWIEATYATPDVTATRAAAFRAANIRAGEQVLDVGCGPGFFLRDLAIAVGSEGRAVGIDISEPMLALAKARCADLSNVEFERTVAAHLPASDGRVDLVCGLQTYAYLEDLEVGLAELHRVLRPGGRAVILDTDFSGLVWKSRDRDRMRRILEAYNRHVAWPDLPRVLPHCLGRSGFEVTRCEALPIVALSYHPNTLAYGVACIIHRFVTESAGVSVGDADAWLAEFDVLERERAFFFALNRFLFVARRQ